MKTNLGGKDLNGLAVCAGVGGLELGLHLALPESRCVCYIEREAYAVGILISRMEEGILDPAPIWDDVTTFDGEQWRGVIDIISAGFPCQPWSSAGKRRGIDDERWIWPSIAKIIRQVRPEYVFLENVPGILDGGLGEVLGDLAKMGFNAEWGRFSAVGVGAPHLRQRIFILARQRDTDSNTQRHGLRDERQEPKISNRGEQLQPGCESTSFRSVVANANGRGQPKEQPDLSSRKQDPNWCNSGCRDEWRSWWVIEPNMGRVVDGMANRVDRLRACGNGVVPAVAARAFTTLYGRIHG